MWLYVLCAILIGLVLLFLFLRIRATVEYSATGLQVRLRLGPVRFQAYPRPPAKAKKKKLEKKREKPEEKAGGMFAQVRTYLPVITQAAGGLKRKIRIDELWMRYTAAAEDPAKAALRYGWGTAGVGILLPLIENNFELRKRHLHVTVDFSISKPVIYILAALSLTLGQLVSIALRCAYQFLCVYRQKQKKEKRYSYGKASN